MPDLHRQAPDPDPTDLEAEGLPDIDEQPPGITAETMEEGLSLPRDHPLGAEEPTTPAEQRAGESLLEREARLQPEEPPVTDDAPPGRLVQPDQGMVGAAHEAQEIGELAEDPGGLSAEEAAVHLVEERPR